MTWSQITAQVTEIGSARKLWEQHRPPTLFTEMLAAELGTDALVEAAREIDTWRDADFRFHTFRDDQYPAQLRDVHQVPPVLFTRGTLLPGENAVSVVGSRRASERALRMAVSLAERLVDRGITVLSGLAEGIDTAAHVTALDRGGRTVAVIGTGIQKYYPAANRSLQDRIAAEGLVMSQFWPDSPPSKSSFPMRNATMSAYGRVTIIVEAGELSGTRIQARSAVAHGRPVILMGAVVRGTNWGRALVGKPGVYQAETPDEAIDHVKRITSSDNPAAGILALAKG
ncbi:DNA-protecting protein DprA [Saccharothrix sp. SC076]|nr:DNA-protecting protein DprA [Saccharothrix obliqua]